MPYDKAREGPFIKRKKRVKIVPFSINRFVRYYEQYKDGDNEEKHEWAEQAKMRANKTASSYNNYILKNSYVWEDNVPSDIHIQLRYIE